MTYDDAVVVTRWTEDEGKVNHPIHRSNRRGQADGKKVKALFEAGWSVILWKPNRFLKNIFHLAALMEQYLMFAASTTIFITPPGSQGLDFHYDTTGSFLLQIHGSKNWSIFPPLIEHPTSMLEGEYVITESEVPARLRQERQNFVLREGDVLWIPRGWYHRGSAVGTVGSAHLALSPERFVWGEVVGRLDLLEARHMEKHRDRRKHIATDGGLPLPLRRDAPYGLGRLSASDFRRELVAVAKEGGIRRARDAPTEFFADWLDDLLAGSQEEMLPPAGVYPPESMARLPAKRSQAEVSALNIELTTPLRVTSAMAARVMNTRKSGKAKASVKYSTGNSAVRYEQKSEPLKVPRKAAAALRKILHVEQNPSGRFAPADIRGVGERKQISIAKELLTLRIAVLESEWHSGSGGFVPPLPGVFTSRDHDACTVRTARSEL